LTAPHAAHLPPQTEVPVDAPQLGQYLAEDGMSFPQDVHFNSLSTFAVGAGAILVDAQSAIGPLLRYKVVINM
jgi:hypothetical protein